MKVIQISHTDATGGASRAAYRIHHALRKSGVDSRMWVNKATMGDWTVKGPSSAIERVAAACRSQLSRPLCRVLQISRNEIHSPAVVPSQWVRRINSCDADVIHLHWVQSEMLSVSDIGRITKPIVWTLHDMWGFCGAEHYAEDDRWRVGYRRDNRPENESGIDLNRWTWNRKKRLWNKPMQIVTPSHWLAKCVGESSLMRNWPITVIPNPIDTSDWQPIPQRLARELLHLPPDVPLLLFGAMDGGKDPRKGFDLLLSAISKLRNYPEAKDIVLVVFGQLEPKVSVDLGFPLVYTGHLHDNLSLRALYSAADMLVLPSRQDNLPNTGVESLTCGTPVVAFNVCGLPDIVCHEKTGYLAKAFDVSDFARGIIWVLKQRGSGMLCMQARERAVSQFSNTIVSKKYKDTYRHVSICN